MARLVKPKSLRALKRDIGFLEHSENVVRVSGRDFCVGEIQVGEMLQHRQRREFVPGGVIQLGGRKIGAFAFLSQRLILFSSESASDASCSSGACFTPIHHLKRFPAQQRLRNRNIREKLDAQKTPVKRVLSKIQLGIEITAIPFLLRPWPLPLLDRYQ